MPDFPNLFMFYGPNGQPRSGGFLFIGGNMGALCRQRHHPHGRNDHDIVEVKRDVFDRYNTHLDEEMKGILWEVEGAGGYYNNEFGRSAVNLPFLTEDYHAMVAEPNPRRPSNSGKIDIA